MNTSRFAGLLVIVTVAAASLFATHCARRPGARRDAAIAYSGALKKTLTENRGKVLILLLGREGCPGTAKATATLSECAPSMAPDVTILRLDVPLPGESLPVASSGNDPFPRIVDSHRQTAGQLDFFFYPTLYLFDREGRLRFEGGCDKARIEQMVREILAETPGQLKKIYTLPKPPVGESAPAFSGKTLGDEVIALESLRGKRAVLLLFAKTSCPFTVEILPALKDIAAKYRSRDAATIIINQGEAAETIRSIYEKETPEVPVLCDYTGEISNAYGVDVTPYFYLLDAKGRIVKRRSFTPEAAVNSLNALLDLAPEKTRFESTKAG